MLKDLQKTVDGCALLEYLVLKLKTHPGGFGLPFVQLHLPAFRQAWEWERSGLDDACVGSLNPETVARGLRPLFVGPKRERNWARVFQHAKTKLLSVQRGQLVPCPASMTLLRYLTGGMANEIAVVEKCKMGKMEKKIQRLEDAATPAAKKRAATTSVDATIS
jgi:hypothetical protein